MSNFFCEGRNGRRATSSVKEDQTSFQKCFSFLKLYFVQNMSNVRTAHPYQRGRELVYLEPFSSELREIEKQRIELYFSPD